MARVRVQVATLGRFWQILRKEVNQVQAQLARGENARGEEDDGLLEPGGEERERKENIIHILALTESVSYKNPSF